ncbi:platelet endothelial cell adhesion molecule-like isoform X2 [Hemicordylus capensis]|nr:platelet endothelial cell adhesion molecule-like isoform X2 [Hemicordylus capensis]
MEVQNGMSIALRCSADISKNEHFPLNYTFSFLKDGVPLDTKTSDQQWAHYNISKARFSDFGVYACRLSVEKKTKDSNRLPITVKGITKPKLTALKKDVKEGETVHLRCEVPEEKPPFWVTFYKNQISQSPPSDQRSRLENEKNFVEIEFPLEVGDKVLFFTCTVTMTSMMRTPEESEPSDRVTIAVSEPFTVPKITTHPPQNITEGDKIFIQCTTVLSHKSQAEIILQKHRKILNSSKGRESVTYSTVATMEDNGNYTCKVELESVSKTSAVNIVVAELFPKPILNYGNKTNMDENSRLIIECQVASPLPINISIMKDNTVVANSSVHFTKAHLSDSGTYVCRAETKGISKESDPVRLSVHAPVSRPILWAAYKSTKVAVLGQVFTLHCYSRLGTLPIQYTLYRGETFVKDVVVSQNRSARFYEEAKDERVQGEYKCGARNGHSRQERSHGLNITVIAKIAGINMHIGPPGDVEDGEHLKFFCTVSSGSLPIDFKFFRENEKKPLYEVTENKTGAAILPKERITSQDAGKYFCTANNDAKLPLQSNTVTVNVVMASWKKGLIGSSVLLILLGITTAAVCWFCCKKTKGKGSSMELARSTPANNSLNEKLTSGQNKGADFYYGSDYNEDSENHIKSKEENREPDLENSEVEYTEVEVSVPDPYRAPVMKKPEIVYTEIRKANNYAEENRNSRIEDSPDGT